MKIATGLAMVVALLAVASTASARTLSMKGQWYQNRGPLVDIPINTGPVLCVGGSLQTGCVNSIKPFGGGVWGSGNANVTGDSPASFTVPTGAFQQSRTAPQTVAVAWIPQVVQLQTKFTLSGPGAGFNNPFIKNAPTNDPGQAARLGPNFTWCPPAGGACASAPGPTPTGTITGPYKAIVKYTAGPNKFGGTMAMLLKGTGVVSVTDTVSVSMGLAHQIVGGLVSNPTFSPQHPGRGYAAFDLDTLTAGPRFATYSTGPACSNMATQPPNPVGCGQILTQMGPLPTLGGDTNWNWGFPWTTGNVFVRNITRGPKDQTTTFSIMGSDSRTALGKGRITLVAGGTTERKVAAQHFAALDVVVVRFDGINTPTLSPPAVAAAATLMALAGGYMARRRLARNDG